VRTALLVTITIVTTQPGEISASAADMPSSAAISDRSCLQAANLPAQRNVRTMSSAECRLRGQPAFHRPFERPPWGHRTPNLLDSFIGNMPSESIGTEINSSSLRFGVYRLRPRNSWYTLYR
jgi:hypothetical protein